MLGFLNRRWVNEGRSDGSYYEYDLELGADDVISVADGACSPVPVAPPLP